MAYNVPSAWLTDIKQPVISNANVLIFNSNNIQIADKVNLSSYTYKGRNSWICKTYPSYEISFTIVDWENYGNKNDLSKGRIISIKYQINNSVTTDTRFYYIYSTQYNYQTNVMTIKAHSLLQELTSNASYTMGKTTTQLIGSVVAKYSSFAMSVGTNQNSYQTIRVPGKVTDGELLQHIAITTNCCLRLNEKAITLVNFKGTLSGYKFDKINVLTKLNRETSDISSSVAAATYYNGEVEQLGTTEKRSINASANFGITYYYQGDEEATNITIKTSGGTPITPSSISYYNDMVWARFSSSANTTYIMTVEGTRANQETIQNENVTTIQSVMILDDTHADSIRLNASEYYSYNEIVDFDCRIDPRLEPLDAIYVESINQYIYAEEVSISFNGGFKGNIKGRLKNDHSMLNPIISALSYTINNFSFRINNPNPFPVHCTIDFDAGDTVDKGTINPNTYIIVNKTNTPALTNVFVDKFTGNLSDDVFCYFEDSGITTIIEAD